MQATLIDSMGSDLSVVNAARVSFDKESVWESVPDLDGFTPLHDVLLFKQQLSDKDKKLIHYLAKHNHFTPFTHCVITLRETVPIFVARQRFKHTVGFTYNEVSRRYVDDAPEFYVPDVWRKKAENVKQGSSDEGVENQEPIKNSYTYAMKFMEAIYNDMLADGVAPEQARMVLPQSLYTSYYATGSLSAFARAYNLRSEESAQKEIQELAISWKNIIEPLFPESWRALVGND